MSKLSIRPMNLYFVEFDELYGRHMCRHSQVGINVIHIVALWGIWYSVYGLLYWLVPIEWVLAIPAAIYLAVLAANLPIRMFVASTAFMASILAALIYLDQPPFWVYLIVIPVMYKIQSWSHSLYTLEFDMTDYDRKYPKGSVLFWVLLIYEVPIVLNFLLFDRKGLTVETESPPDQAPAAANTSS